MQFIESEYQKLSEKEKEQYKNSVEKFRQIAREFTTEQLHEDIRIPRKYTEAGMGGRLRP